MALRVQVSLLQAQRVFEDRIQASFTPVLASGSLSFTVFCPSFFLLLGKALVENACSREHHLTRRGQVLEAQLRRYGEDRNPTRYLFVKRELEQCLVIKRLFIERGTSNEAGKVG